jgi:hypothetical protein
LKLYCDGQLVASAEAQDKPLGRGDNYLYVGRFSGAYFRGCIDEPALYNYAMTADQVAELYGQLVGVEDELPNERIMLHLAAPNPFNDRTTLRFDLPVRGSVRLGVYDAAGRLIRTLLDVELPAGSHQAVWDGRDSAGRGVPSGSYFARLSAGGRVETERMGLVR